MKIIITPFLIILGILEILLLLMSVNYLFIDNNGGKALGGTIAFFGFIIFLFIIGFEQLILNTVKLKKEIIWITEFIIITIAIIYFYFNGISIA